MRLKTGFIDVDYDEYHAHRQYKRIASYSGFKNFARSPSHFRAYKGRPMESTPAMILGDAFHLFVLDLDEYDRRVSVWRGGRKSGGEWKDFAEENEGKLILSPKDEDMIKEMAQSILNHELARAIIRKDNRIVEETGFYKDPEYKFWITFRVDLRLPDQKIIVDLKSAVDASPDKFSRDCANYKYHMQAAVYLDGVKAVTGDDYEFYFLVVEKAPPYAVAVYRCTEHMIDVARDELSPLRANFAECIRTNSWPGYSWSVDVIDLELPRWAK